MYVYIYIFVHTYIYMQHLHIHTYMIVDRCGRATGKSLGDMGQSGSQQQPSNAALPPNKFTFLLCFPCPLLIPQYVISMEYNLQRIHPHEHTLDVAQTIRWCVIYNADEYTIDVQISVDIFVAHRIGPVGPILH